MTSDVVVALCVAILGGVCVVSFAGLLVLDGRQEARRERLRDLRSHTHYLERGLDLEPSDLVQDFLPRER